MRFKHLLWRWPVVNGILEPIREVAGVKAVFYGISIAGVALLLGLERFCPRST